MPAMASSLSILGLTIRVEGLPDEFLAEKTCDLYKSFVFTLLLKSVDGKALSSLLEAAAVGFELF